MWSGAQRASGRGSPARGEFYFRSSSTAALDRVLHYSSPASRASDVFVGGAGERFVSETLFSSPDLVLR